MLLFISSIEHARSFNSRGEFVRIVNWYNPKKPQNLSKTASEHRYALVFGFFCRMCMIPIWYRLCLNKINRTSTNRRNSAMITGLSHQPQCHENRFEGDIKRKYIVEYVVEINIWSREISLGVENAWWGGLRCYHLRARLPIGGHLRERLIDLLVTCAWKEKFGEPFSLRSAHIRHVSNISIGRTPSVIAGNRPEGLVIRGVRVIKWDLPAGACAIRLMESEHTSEVASRYDRLATRI